MGTQPACDEMALTWLLFFFGLEAGLQLFFCLSLNC